jgi:hypothetical protein
MQIRKKGDEIKKKSSPLKLQSQSQIQDGTDGHNFERGPSKDHFSTVWLKLAQ